MKTQTKLGIASAAAGTMMWLNILSHPLGLSEGVQWVLIIGAFFPLWLAFVYRKRLKEEKSREDASGLLPASKIEDRQRRGRRRVIIIWICMVAFSMSFQFWLPLISGINLSRTGNFLVSILTVLTVSLIFWLRLKKMPNLLPRTTSQSDASHH